MMCQKEEGKTTSTGEFYGQHGVCGISHDVCHLCLPRAKHIQTMYVELMQASLCVDCRTKVSKPTETNLI